MAATRIARTRLAALVGLGVMIERQWVEPVCGITQGVARVRLGLGGCESIDEWGGKGICYLIVNAVPITNTTR
jgi:hypothetical protein